MRYRVAAPEPHSHLFEVEATLDQPGPQPVFAMPVWTPGSYLVREFARHLEGVAAEDGEGRALAVERLDKHRFRVDAGGCERAVLRYRVYANELTVRTCHLDGRHGYFNGAGLFLYAEGREGEPCTLRVDAPPGWRVSTALAPQGAPSRSGFAASIGLAPQGAPDGSGFAASIGLAPQIDLAPGPSYMAKDYDELVDSPVEMGTHEIATFEAMEKPHAVAVFGRGNLDLGALAGDLRRVVESLGRLMGGLPYDRYLFIVHLTEKRRGGLEHARSSTLNVHRMGFFPREAYEETVALAAHEFFHLWNVKRLRPAAFRPFDYSREQYTRLLWWFEGVTSYYDALIVTRAGIRDARRYLKHLGEELTALERTPGARKMSLEEASLTAWVKYYRPDENSANSAVSYYLKGELVTLALDLALRRAGRSLDELVRLLYGRHAGDGLPEDGVERACAELLGSGAARAFFDRHVRGTGPLDLPLEAVGLRLRRRRSLGFDDKGGTPESREKKGVPGWLGAEVASGPKLIVTSVRQGSPAHRAGLYADDEIVAESGFRIERAALSERLLERGPEGVLRLAVFRCDELVEVQVPLGEPPEDAVWVEPIADATADQRAAFESWTGVTLPSAEDPARD